MNIKTIKIGFASLGMIALLSACGKYEEGPGFTVLTKKARLTGIWDAQEYVSSTGSTSTDNDDATIEFTKSGTCLVNSNDPNFPFSISGTWEFVSDKEKVKLTFAGSSDEFTIMRLTNSELWAKDSDGDITKYEKKK